MHEISLASFIIFMKECANPYPNGKRGWIFLSIVQIIFKVTTIDALNLQIRKIIFLYENISLLKKIKICKYREKDVLNFSNLKKREIQK